MDNLDLKPLNPDDWQLLRSMRIRLATVHPTLFYDTPETASAHPPAHWQNLLNHEGNKFWALFDKDKCIGITGIVAVESDTSGQTAMIGYTFREPGYEGRHIGEAFYDVRLDHAVSFPKWKKVLTDHRIGNGPSEYLILKYGFVQTEKVMITWPDGKRDYELRYELDLEKVRSAPKPPLTRKPIPFITIFP